MRPDRWAAVTMVLLAACGPARTLTRPEGNGGWSPERRQEELTARATAAGVDFGTTARPSATEPAAGPPGGPLDLPTALALAAHGNRRIGEAEKDLDVAEARFRDARGRLLPATTGSGRYTRFTDELTTNVVLPPSLLKTLGGKAPTVVVRAEDAAVFNGTVTVPLDVTGEILHVLRAAQAGYRGERARLWATTLEQQLVVIRSYFDLLEAGRLRDVTEQTLASERQQLANAQSRFDNGRLTKNELLVVQVAVRNSEQRLLQRDLAIDQARWSLNQAVGLAVNAPTAVIDVATRPDIPATDEALRQAYATNPALAALLEEQQRVEDTATALKRSRFPRLSAGGAVDYTTSDIVQPQRLGSGFVGFTWDLGTDTRREAQIAEAQATVERNRIEIERALRELEALVRSTQREAEERLAALDAAEVAVGQADENLRIRRQQFDAGRATSDDVLDAVAILASERATLATALYQAHTRRAELQSLMGLPLDALTAER
jgi:outer membrane protein